MGFKEISIKDWTGNPYTLFGKEWGLLCAGNEKSYNLMTISWGSLGSLWVRESKPVVMPSVTVYVQKSRYTYSFMERENRFAVAFLPDGYKKELTYLGSASGRDEDKFACAGLTPLFENGTVYPAQAKLVFICRKCYGDHFHPEGFCGNTIPETVYPDGKMHKFYIGEIEKVLIAGSDA